MNPALARAPLIAAKALLWAEVELRAPGEGGAWRTVQGWHARGSAEQGFSGYGSRFVVADERLDLDPEDFPGGWPGKDWWMRKAGGEVFRLAEPMRRRGVVIFAPLRPHNVADGPAPA